MKKIIMGMFKKINGGKSAVAGFLGMTEAELNNRIYQTKGQRFTEEELIAIETEFNVSDWSDEINRQLGKVSVKTPHTDNLDLVEFAELQLHDRSASGKFYLMLDEFISDGELTEDEQSELRKLLYKLQQTKQEMFESVVKLYSKK